MDTQTIKIDLNGNYEIVQENKSTSYGAITQDSGLQQLDAFLTSLRSALGKDNRKLVSNDLASAIRTACESSTAVGSLLSLTISSTLDPKNNCLSYTFSLRRDHGKQA